MRDSLLPCSGSIDGEADVELPLTAATVGCDVSSGMVVDGFPIVALSCMATLNARSSSKSDSLIPRRRASLLISSVAIRCHKILSLRSTMVAS